MLVSGGIGLTPFASALTSLLRYKFVKSIDPTVTEPIRPSKVYLYWLFQFQDDFFAFEWFVKLLADLRLRYLALKAQQTLCASTQLSQSQAPEANVVDIELQLNLIITRGDPKTNKYVDWAYLVEYCREKGLATPTEATKADSKDAALFGSTVAIGSRVSVRSDRPQKTVEAARDNAAARAFECLKVMAMAEHDHQAHGEPFGNDVCGAKIVAGYDYPFGRGAPRAGTLAFKAGDELTITSRSASGGGGGGGSGATLSPGPAVVPGTTTTSGCTRRRPTAGRVPSRPWTRMGGGRSAGSCRKPSRKRPAADPDPRLSRAQVRLTGARASAVSFGGGGGGGLCDPPFVPGELCCLCASLSGGL